MVSSLSLKNVCVCMTGSKFAGMYNSAALAIRAAVVATLCGFLTCIEAPQRGHSAGDGRIARTAAWQ
jgi:hypothetical protein